MLKSLRVYEDIYVVGGADLSHPYDCAVYLVDGGQEMMLIDSGAGEGYELIVDNARSLGLHLEQLKVVVATHAHIDHIGALFQFRRDFRVLVVAHALDQEAIETGIDVGAEYYGVDYQPCKVDIILDKPEQTLGCGKYELKAVHIPGHTPGSIALYLDAGVRILFGQDVHGPYSLARSDRGQAQVSLQRLIDLEADILCEGHFGVYEGKDVVTRYIEGYLCSL